MLTIPSQAALLVADNPVPQCVLMVHDMWLIIILQLHQQLELERSARHDLEMHTTALEHQKAVLQDEAIALRKNLDDGEFCTC